MEMIRISMFSATVIWIYCDFEKLATRSSCTFCMPLFSYSKSHSPTFEFYTYIMSICGIFLLELIYVCLLNAEWESFSIYDTSILALLINLQNIWGLFTPVLVSALVRKNYNRILRMWLTVFAEILNRRYRVPAPNKCSSPLCI